MNNPKITNNGYKHWYNEKGQLHREDGPAIEFADGDKWWFLNDVRLTEKEWIIQTKFNFQKIIIT